MNALLERFQAYWRSRTERERWLLGCVAAIAIIFLFQLSLIGPLQSWVAQSESDVAYLEAELIRATRLAGDVRRLQGELEQIKAQVAESEQTNLFNLLENLAASTKVKNQLESIKPKKPSGNEQFPETRVEVSLKGVTLEQMVKFMYQIENTDRHLIIRSVRVRRPIVTGNALTKGPPRLDVNLSVSSFERGRGESSSS